MFIQSKLGKFSTDGQSVEICIEAGTDSQSVEIVTELFCLSSRIQAEGDFEDRQSVEICIEAGTDRLPFKISK